MALFGGNLPARAQQQPAAKDDSKQDALQEIVVTGIRYSVEQSLKLKEQAVGTIDVVTSESVGKLPDRNVADALQRLPGVDISTESGSEGGFDEADRVSMRGTSPSLTQTMIDGHAVATGDWFVLNQSATVGRSVNYTLLPSELIKQIKVYKSSEASLLEGGTAGTVDIITRKPLDFHQSVTLDVSAGAVYATLPGTTDPQLSFLGNWVNGDRTFGAMLQLFSETRHLRRDGQELLGYAQIDPKSSLAAAVPALSGVYYPNLIGSALFQQKRQRNGGLLDVEWQPSDALSLNLSAFSSKLEASNLNDNYLLWPQQFIGSDNQAPLNYTVQNNTLVAGTWAPVTGNLYGVYDQISRPNESASTNYGVLTAEFKPSNSLSLLGEVGLSEGHGRTPNQDVSETLPGAGAGAWYHLNGTTTAASWNLINTNNTSPFQAGTPVGFSWIFGDQNMDAVDSERWAKLDATFAMNGGVFTDFKFGARYADHDRHLWGAIGQGPGCDGGPLQWSDGPFACPNPAVSGLNPANYPTSYQNYPSNFANGLGAGFPTEIWYWSSSQLAAYNSLLTNRDPVTRADWTTDYGVHEKDSAVYFQADLAGDRWSANAGVRLVRTDESSAYDNGIGVTLTTPGAITTSAFGPYVVTTVNHTYTNVLPSANFKFDLTHDLIARLDASETMTRPDYSALAGALNLIVPSVLNTTTGQITAGSGTGGNPNLKPTTSTNLDAGLEWYFAPKSMVAGELFYMRLKDYVSYGTLMETINTEQAQTGTIFPGVYSIAAPIPADGEVKGVELSYVQSILTNWGIETNYTYVDGSQTSNIATTGATAGNTRLFGTSKDTFNVIGYYENNKFSARVAYTYRSDFYAGFDRGTEFTQKGEGTLAASLNYDINDAVQISLQGLNLNDPELKYFTANTSQPRAFYRNGAQYYLTVNMKF